MNLFGVLNTPAFKYYTEFIILYSALIIAWVALIFVKKHLDKNYRIQKKVLKKMGQQYLFYGITGLILLYMRHAYVKYLSMEFLHVLLLLGIALTTGFGAYRLKYGYPKRKKKTTT